MRTLISLLLLALTGPLLPAVEVPLDFKSKIVHQTAEEWKWAVGSSHADRLIDAPADSPHLGKEAA